MGEPIQVGELARPLIEALNKEYKKNMNDTQMVIESIEPVFLSTKQYQRKPFQVEAVKVTKENMETVADWCGGKIEESHGKKFIRVPVIRAWNDNQTKASEGHFVVKSDQGFRTFSGTAFERIFEQI